MVDVLGLVLKGHRGAANQADVKAAPWVLFRTINFGAIDTYGRLAKVLADQGYRGVLEGDFAQVYEVDFEIVKHQGKGYSVQPKRWIVERTWAWLENCRGLTWDYERLPQNHEGMVYGAMIRLMLRRLDNNRRRGKKETP